MNTTSEKNDANKEHENGNAQDNQNDKDADVIQTTINEEDFIDGLDVVDVWDDEDQPRRRSWDRARGKERRNSRERDRDQEHQERDRQRERNRDRSRDRDNYRSRRRSRSNERRREAARRDPNKSSKDIEQDKIRAKKDNESKILAEKEKAIKTLLDSDTVLPPGTESEAIQNIVDKSNQQLKRDEEEDLRKQLRRSRENRPKLRSPLRNRLGFRRSPEIRRRSPEIRRRSPIAYSPERRRRRSPIAISPEERRRRGSFERETSADRREASRRRLRERETKFRRSRSRDRRSRSHERRSLDRHRSRSRSHERRRRSSRSPYESRRRRSMSRSPNRGRRRSPFLNEIVRQFQNEPIGPPIGPPGGMPPNFGPPPPGMHPGPPQPGMLGAPPGLLPTPQGLIPPGMMPPGPMDPMGPPIHMGIPPNPGGPPPPQFMSYDGCPPPGLNFDPLNRGPDFTSGPMMYGQPNHLQPPTGVPMPTQLGPPSPQPVPAPGQILFPSVVAPMQSSLQKPLTMVPGPKYSPSGDGHRSSGSKREDRMRTPEPPIISDFKQNEKTSLSSLLEASVSTKDSSSQSSSRGFKPEIIRHCERALRNLPAEDPRLKMKGRFFFDPLKKLTKSDKLEAASNSILLRRGRTEIYWNEEENEIHHQDQNQSLAQPNMNIGPRKITHQKICQTDETVKENAEVQTEILTNDFSSQVSPKDFEPPPKESRWEPAPIQQQQQQNYDDGPNRHPPKQQQEAPLQQRGNMEERFNNRQLADRLDWSMRETFDHSSKLRDSDDLRWSLNKNSSRERPQPMNWQRGFSPNRQMQPIVSDHMHGSVGSGSNMPLSGIVGRGVSNEILRERMAIDRGMIDRGIDMRERDMILHDRNMDMRDRDIDIRDREMDIRDRDMDIRNRDMDLRSRDMDFRDREMENMWDRDRGMPNSRDMRGAGMMDMEDGVHEPLENFGGRRDLDDYPIGGRRELADDYDMRKGNNFAGIGNFVRKLDRDLPPTRDSPTDIIEDDDPEELEIIEERVIEREQPWQPRNVTNLNVFNNARGGAAMGRGAIKRPFRGRIGNNVGFNNRMNF